jgi:hypothetical protein
MESRSAGYGCGGLDRQVQDSGRQGIRGAAILLRDTETIATWVSSELIGVSVSEALVVPGFYTLQVTSVFTSKKPGTVNIEFQLNNAAKVPVSFSGQSPTSRAPSRTRSSYENPHRCVVGHRAAAARVRPGKLRNRRIGFHATGVRGDGIHPVLQGPHLQSRLGEAFG